MSNGLAVVTGCNRGLGFGIAKRLVQEGFHVAAVCRRLADAQKTVDALGACCCMPFELDFNEGEAAVQAVASAIAAWAGKAKIKVLVNNAGNSHGAWDTSAWADSSSVNYKGPVLLTEALLPALARGACVTMVGSGLGELKLLSPKYRRLLTSAQTIGALNDIVQRPLNLLDVSQSWVGPYGLSKALIHRATEIFADDCRFKREGIIVNAVCPGWVCTDMGGDQAPIEVEEGAGHILENALNPDTAAAGTFFCHCFKNYDDEHNRAWEVKHGHWAADTQHSKKTKRTHTRKRL